jgi:hypothetical protein
MSKKKLLGSVGLGLLLLAGGFMGFAGDRDDPRLDFGGHDFALFDGTNPANQPDAGAVCFARRGRPFLYHLAVTNHASGEDGFVRVTYADGDFVQFPIAANGSFGFSQAAGSRGGADRAVRISNGGSGASLVGVLSATNARCASCDAVSEGGIGDAGCDAIVPN